MRAAITGGAGFMGWHLACRLRADGVEPRRIGREDFADRARLRRLLSEVDVIFHLAGANRHPEVGGVETTNIWLAKTLVAALPSHPIHIVYANSVHQGTDSEYGRGKAAAAQILGGARATLADVRLPNLFGEHGRPDYNSFVATFCAAVVNDRTPELRNDRSVELLHAQRAAQALIDASAPAMDSILVPEGEGHRISEVLLKLQDFHRLYGSRAEIPTLRSKFDVDLFNTYRSFLAPPSAPVYPEMHRDARGELFEGARAHGSTGQVFVSTTVPGAVRGEHYHLSKIERFVVVKGEAEISMRRLLHNDVVRLKVDGTRPGIVDMPTLWVHNIRNVGSQELVTIFWSDQLLDPHDPDQYAEYVEVAR